MSALRYRVTDGTRAHEFNATGAASLVAGIRAGIATIAAERGCEGHPAVVLRARLDYVDRWLTERLARQDAAPDARTSWIRQAEYWRWQAHQTYVGAKSDGLDLHVKATTHAAWLCIDTANGIAPRVTMAIDKARAAGLVESAQRVVAHVENLMSLASGVTDAVSNAYARRAEDQVAARRAAMRIVRST